MDPYWSFYQDLFLHLTDGIFFVGEDRRLTLWNRGAEMITGYGADTVLGRTCSEVFACEDFAGYSLCSACPFVKPSVNRGVTTKLLPVFIKNKSGQRLQVLANSYPKMEKPLAVTGAILVFYYNVEAVQNKEKMKQLIRRAFLDSVTGLYNKSYMQGKLEQFMDHYKTTGQNFALIFINVLQLNRINTSYGENGGDAVLQKLSSILSKLVEEHDVLGRWHGANFLLITPASKKSALFMYENRIRNTISELKFPIAEKLVDIKVTVAGTMVRSYDSLYSALSRAECSAMKEPEGEELAEGVNITAEPIASKEE